MIATNVGRGAVDAGSAENERHESVRQRRVVLTPRCWRQVGGSGPANDGGKRAVHRGERVISRKAIAQGVSDVLRCPVCSCAHFLCTLRMRSRVQRASGIPCALFIFGGERFQHNSGAMRRGIVDTHSVSSSATGSAEWPPDDRLRRTIQYSRDAYDRTEKPRCTGSPAFAGDDSYVWSGSLRVIARSPCDEAIHASASGKMDCFASLAMTAGAV